MTKKLALLGAAMTCVAVACSSSPATSESTTTAATTIAATTTTVTLAATTTAAPTTVPAPTTTLSPDDQLKAQIAADYVSAFDRNDAIFADPSQGDLESLLAEVVVAGSPQYSSRLTRLLELRNLGDQVRRIEPFITMVTVENVELLGSAPYTDAVVTVCEVLNLEQVTPAKNSPTGKDIPVGGEGSPRVTRLSEPVQLVNGRWLPFVEVRYGDRFRGVQTCPAP